VYIVEFNDVIGILHFILYILYITLLPIVSISYYSDWKIQCCLEEDFNQRHLLYKTAQIIALSTVSFITMFGMSMRCVVRWRVSHIFGLCREFFLDVHCLKICSSAHETVGVIIQTPVVLAAECLSKNGVQLLQIFEAEESSRKFAKSYFIPNFGYMRHEKTSNKIFPYKMWL